MKRAFTLIEVLTVILIICIIAAITFPVMFAAKARAKQVICESNLKQAYLAIQLYENDYSAKPYLTTDDPHWIAAYTGGVKLTCPNTASHPELPNYVVTAGNPRDAETNAQSKHWSNLLDECREKRGSSFPVAFDANHARKVDGYQGDGQRVILVRESGAVARPKFRHPTPDWIPCSPELVHQLQH